MELASGQALNSGDLRRAFQEITRVTADVLEVDRSGIWLFDESGKELSCHTIYDAASEEFGSGWELATKEFPNYLRALRSQRVIAAEDARNDLRTKEFAEPYLIPQGIVSVMDAPFRHKGRVAGVIWNEARTSKIAWSTEAQSFAASMADMVTVALEAWERKRAEEELANTFGKMRSTFESTRDGILISDMQGRVLEFNDAFLNISKIPPRKTPPGHRESWL